MFTDYAKIYIRSGKGGDGHVSFRRELFVPDGGPDGGDGGRGGDIIFEVDKGLNTLTDFRHVRKYVAENGEEGGKRRCHGRNGKDLVVRVPEGTVVYDEASGSIVADMSGENTRQGILEGGRGGLGNMHFATATMQAPKYAQPGKPAKELNLRLELKVIADVGLIGFPNVGKSTLLSRSTNARPKIANYHFTTLAPNLGVADLGDGRSFVLADIPGLIEGASEGAGLGHQFLRHIERTRLLVHVVDAAGSEGRDPVEDIRAINAELTAYSEKLGTLPQIIAANKTDLLYGDEETDPVEAIRTAFADEGWPVFAISAATGEGIPELMNAVYAKLMTMPRETVVFTPDFVYPLDPDEDLPYTVTKEAEGEYRVEGPKIDKMLGYTNLESEKGFLFFQKFLKDAGILADLEKAGIKDGDTVHLYGWDFDYYK